VGLLDILRGQRPPKRANLDRLFALSTAYTTLTVNLGLEPTGRAGICFKSVEAGVFAELTRDVEQLLELSRQTTGTTVRWVDDELGFRWCVLEDPDFDDLVTTAHMVNQSLEERGFSEQLLCSTFGLIDPSRGGALLYFVYAYKRGTFYPFAPLDGEKRDTAVELRLQGALARELPIEPELERWYPVWGLPL
jgi:hypothetical protein